MTPPKKKKVRTVKAWVIIEDGELFRIGDDLYGVYLTKSRAKYDKPWGAKVVQIKLTIPQ